MIVKNIFLPALRMMNQQPEVNVHVMEWIWDPLLEAGGPAAHWIGPGMLVDLMIEGRNVNALCNVLCKPMLKQYIYIYCGPNFGDAIFIPPF